VAVSEPEALGAGRPARLVGRLVQMRARWLQAGMDRDDLARLEAAVAAGRSAAAALTALARVYERLLVEAEASGHGRSACDYGRRAALCHLMRIARRLTPPARALTVALPGRAAAAYVRRPARGGPRAPVVLLLAEPSAGKEEFGRLEERLLVRGLATLSADLAAGDGPAAGEALVRAASVFAQGRSECVGVWAGGAAGAGLALSAVTGEGSAGAVVVPAAPSRGGARCLRLGLGAAACPVALVAAAEDDAQAPTGVAFHALDEYGLDSVADWLAGVLRRGEGRA
jgi:hypothetical protein